MLSNPEIEPMRRETASVGARTYPTSAYLNNGAAAAHAARVCFVGREPSGRPPLIKRDKILIGGGERAAAAAAPKVYQSVVVRAHSTMTTAAD